MTAPRKQTHGPSTPMPTVKLELGRYVVLKRRADGTHRALFQVPERLRPSGWLPAIRLPIEGEWPGRLEGAEVAAIQRDAAGLYEQLQRDRLGVAGAAPTRSLAALVRAWQRTPEWADLRPKSRVHYTTYINHIQAWSEAARHPDPTTLTRTAINDFLALFNDAPTTKKHTLKTLRIIMAQAVAAGWRADNPCTGIRIKAPKTKVVIWEQADVDLYVACARDAGMTSIALIILLEWEIGQRLTDVRAFRPGMEYDRARGVFSFAQSKTDSAVEIEVSPALREMLNEGSGNQMFLFRNERTGKAYTEDRLSKTFAWVRQAAVKRGGRFLLLRQLRHSCVVQLARAGCTTIEIAHVTGHAVASVAKILSVYLPRDSQVARTAQEKRGLVKVRVAV